MQTQEPAATTAEEAPSIPSRTARETWRTFLDPWWKAMQAITPIFVLSRITFLLFTYVGGILFFVPNYWPGTVEPRDLLYTWYRWDAVRFIDVAQYGYTKIENTAFFPLFPSLIQALHTATHLDYLALGMLISNVAFFAMLIVFYRLVATEFDVDTAKRASLYLTIYPTAFFFFAAYNESLFLLFFFLSIYALRRGSWWLAGLFGFLAMLTRSIALFLALLFVCEFVRQRWSQLRLNWSERRIPSLLKTLAPLAAVLLIPAGLAIYSYGLYIRFDDAFAFSHAQSSWRMGLSFPWIAPFAAIQGLFTYSPFTFAYPHILIDLGSLLLFIVLLFMTCFGPERFSRSHWPFIVFGFLAIIYSVLFPSLPSASIPYDPLQSLQRFVLEIFAGFIILARLGRRSWFHNGYLLISLPWLAFLTLQFMTHHWTV